MKEQLTFDLAQRPALGREAFTVSGCNALALAQIEDWRAWPNGKLALVGPEGSGKTHLVHVFAALSSAVVLGAEDLLAGALPLDAPALVLEDFEKAAGNAEAEEAAFHLHNALAARGAPFMVTGRVPPSRWAIALPDLASRLGSAAVARIEAPDDALMIELMRKLFRDRQVSVPQDVLEFLCSWTERSFASAEACVALIDAAALREKRDITRPFVSEKLREAGVI